MARDEDIAAIAERARQTRKPTPRWLWLAAAIIGAICTTGFAIALLRERGATSQSSEARSKIAAARDSGSGLRTGLGTGMVIGAAVGLAVGIVTGIAIGRQRSHSSRSNP